MPTLLQLDSSIDPDTSVSRALTARFAQGWAVRGPQYRVVVHDLVSDPVPHLSHESLHWAKELRNDDAPSLPEADAALDAVREELLAADVVVIGAPMYNFSIPSTLKTWLDHVHIPGTLASFDGTPRPMEGRLAVIISSRGDAYDPGTATAGWDHTLPPLSIVLGTSLGMRVETITVSRTLSRTLPGMADQRQGYETELAAAKVRVDALAASA
jgi:FMN-dependent NADH-azoreductase